MATAIRTLNRPLAAVVLDLLKTHERVQALLDRGTVEADAEREPLEYRLKALVQERDEATFRETGMSVQVLQAGLEL